MKAGSFASLTGLLLVTTGAISAQQPVIQPPAPLPHAPAALRVPQPLSGLQPGSRDLYQEPNRPDLFQQLRPTADLFPTSPFVFVPGFVYGLSTVNVASANPSPQTAVARGGLRFETQPDLAQVYVDGFYVGIVEDYGLRGRTLDLTVGAHRIELRAAGYETSAFDVTIVPNGIVRYRGDLRAPAPPAAAAKVSPSSKTIYVIPQCYAGDTPPLGVLPARCRLADMRVRLLP